MVLKRLYL